LNRVYVFRVYLCSTSISVSVSDKPYGKEASDFSHPVVVYVQSVGKEKRRDRC
jgi:hypothetical protein